MVFLPRNCICLGSVARHVGPADSRLSDVKGDAIYEAYLGNLDAAKALAAHTPALYHDAWLSLNVAVECFFKHVYCLIRQEFERLQSPKNQRHPLGPIEYDEGFLYYHRTYRGKDKRNRHILVEDFRHEVLELWTLFDRFTDANSNPHFQGLKQYIKTGSEWVHRRYERRAHANLKSEYLNYFSDFDGMLGSTQFRGLR